MKTEESGKTVSIIIPFYNEEESIRPLFIKLMEVFPSLPKGSEVIFIDDGSTDKSNEIVRQLCDKHSFVRCVLLSRNFGQTAAWAAGIQHARGEILVFLDCDLQNDPADIPRLLNKLNEGYDVVSGWRKKRKDKLFTRRIPSWIANALISRITGVRLHDYGCSLKAYRRDVIKDVKLYGEMHRFLPAYTSWAGARTAEIVVEHHPRKFGTSKYGLVRIFKVSLDLITVKFLGSYVTKPIYFFGAIACALFLLGLVTFGIVAYRVLILNRLQATPMAFMMVLFFVTAVQFISIGLLAEIAIRTHYEAQNITAYKVRETWNLEKS